VNVAPDAKESPLLRALAITRAMLTAAHAQDWEQVSVLEAAREPLLHRQHPADADSHAQLGEVLAYDRELQALVSHARETAARQWQQHHGRARAIAAYGQS
jgi:hypothetical protein